MVRCERYLLEEFCLIIGVSRNFRGNGEWVGGGGWHVNEFGGVGGWKQVFDGEELNAGVGFTPQFLGVTSGDDFFGHFAGGGFKGKKDADGGVLFTVQDAAQVADVANVDVTAFDLDEGFEHFAITIQEGDDAIDAFITTLFALFCACAAQGTGIDKE